MYFSNNEFRQNQYTTVFFVGSIKFAYGSFFSNQKLRSWLDAENIVQRLT